MSKDWLPKRRFGGWHALDFKSAKKIMMSQIDCKIFGTVCTPENPVGSCMVSSEGACAAHYSYGRFRDIPVVAQKA